MPLRRKRTLKQLGACVGLAALIGCVNVTAMAESLKELSGGAARPSTAETSLQILPYAREDGERGREETEKGAEKGDIMPSVPSKAISPSLRIEDAPHMPVSASETPVKNASDGAPPMGDSLTIIEARPPSRAKTPGPEKGAEKLPAFPPDPDRITEPETAEGAAEETVEGIEGKAEGAVEESAEASEQVIPQEAETSSPPPQGAAASSQPVTTAPDPKTPRIKGRNCLLGGLSEAEAEALNAWSGKTRQAAAWCVLTQLHITGKNLTFIPDAVGKLILLKRLDLAHNQIKSVPASLGALKNLRFLSLNGNQVTRLPPEIGGLSGLRQLSIAKNNLTELPPEISKLTQLLVLSAEQNKLTHLPVSITGAKRLEWVNLEGNLLTEIPEVVFSLPKLDYLDVSNNRVTAVEKDIAIRTKAHFINLQGNPLTHIEKSFCRTPRVMVDQNLCFSFAP